jgi:hypothetical protein
MTIDGDLRALFRRYLPKADGWRWTPVETGGTVSGVADSFYAHETTRTSGWVEFKKTDGWVVKFRPHQVAWLTTYAGGCGVPCTIATRGLGLGSGGGAGDSLWVAAGSCARLLEEGGLRALEGSPALLGRWLGPPRAWDWTEVGRILTSSRAGP